MREDQARGLHRSAARSAYVCVASGKGGVGKTNLVANLAVAAAGLGARALVVDGDFGLSNVDVLLGLAPLRNLSDVLAERCCFDEALVRGPRGVAILPANSGGDGLAALGRRGAELMVERLEEISSDYDLVLIDAGAGIGPVVVGLATACPHVLVVLSPDPTSLADAYATCKVLWRASPRLRLEAVVNGALSAREARDAHGRLERMVRRFLKRDLALRTILPMDPRLGEAVKRQRAVVDLYPTARSSRRLVALARGLLRERHVIHPISGGPHHGWTHQ